ncbi:MAG TPA: tetratricopeptide repeat protein [Candidatus Avalokitesvara rifleensis]|uniref:tetratricopeptide repeat protein n=1 Tax=Candidatus Avalokitesvara rifleensis TaxID=3367620 RepID=UPI00271279C6|nr:tetratricopeptide repeat protein [Candidatus Brocadiales bacterium]
MVDGPKNYCPRTSLQSLLLIPVIITAVILMRLEAAQAQDAQELLNKGIEQDKLRNDEEAIEYYDKALAIDPNNVLALTNKGVALSELGRHEEAISCYDKALMIDPNNVLALTNKGAALSRLGRYEEAIECYYKTLEIEPKDAWAWSAMGYALNSMSRYEEAINCYNKALEYDTLEIYQNRKNVLTWLGKGRTLYNLSKHKEAIDCWDNVLNIDPNHTQAWSLKGIALANLGRYPEAIECYNKALEIEPKDAWVWNLKGIALRKMGREQEALDCYEKALDINPKFATAWNNKGTSLYQLNNIKGAETATKKAIKLDENEPTYFNNLGAILLNLKQYDKAEKAFLKALKLKETWVSSSGLADVYIQIGDELQEKQFYEDALEHLNDAAKLGILENKEQRIGYYFQRGYINARLGNWREAEGNFLQCRGIPKAERNIRRIRDRLQWDGNLSIVLVIGGYSLTGISFAVLATSLVFHLIKIKGKMRISSGTLIALVPISLLFMAIGIALPYIRTITGPGGITFEKEITINPEPISSEIQLEALFGPESLATDIKLKHPPR